MGKLVAFYGINNIGKSTQAGKIVDKLKEISKSAILIKYPVYDLSPSGPFLNNILRSNSQQISEEELQIWFALNRFQNEKNLKLALESYDFVILEDYTATGIVWGMAKGLSEKWLETINQPLRKEDQVILLYGKRDIDSREPDHIHESQDDLTARCQEIFLSLGARRGWIMVETKENHDETTAEIWKKMQSLIA